MISKNVAQWITESEKYSSIYYEKYAQAWSEYKCPESTRNYYCQVSKNYWNLRELLQHIANYGVKNISGNNLILINKNQCSACKYNVTHADNLIATYEKHKKWINQVIWNS